MSLRDEIARFARFLLAALDALIDEACDALEREAASLEAETARRKAAKGKE